jgi:hypothetical protein
VQGTVQVERIKKQTFHKTRTLSAIHWKQERRERAKEREENRRQRLKVKRENGGYLTTGDNNAEG